MSPVHRESKLWLSQNVWTMRCLVHIYDHRRFGRRVKMGKRYISIVQKLEILGKWARAQIPSTNAMRTSKREKNDLEEKRKVDGSVNTQLCLIKKLVWNTLNAHVINSPFFLFIIIIIIIRIIYTRIKDVYNNAIVNIRDFMLE